MMKRTYLKPYKSYVFKDKDPIIDVLRTAVSDSKRKYSSIQADSGVSTATLYNWFHGATRRPQFCTVNAVARALGKELRLMDRKSHAQLRVIKGGRG